MSWDRLVPDLTQELMRQKIQECISETLETNNQALVTDLGNFELATLEHWADITTKFAKDSTSCKSSIIGYGSEQSGSYPGG